MKRAVIYTRISRDDENLGLGVLRQEVDCRQLVDERGWHLAGVLTDNSLSAYTKKRKRPGYQELLELVKEGAVDVIVAWHPDRLHRDLAELEAFIDLVDIAGVDVVTVVAGTYDLSTPSGRFVARNLGAAARYESEHKQERIRRKHLEIAMAGRPNSGRRAYGYRYDPITKLRTIVPEEAAVIREAATLALAGVSLRSITADLNARNVPTAGAKRWVSSNLRRILMAARIAGQREHHGQVVADGTWDAIISPAESARLRELLSDPSRRAATPPRRYLLSGLVRCGRCHTVMVSRPKVNNRRGYACQSGPPWFGCGRMFIQAEPLEEVIVGAVVDVLSGDRVVAELVEHADEPDVDDARAEVAASEAELLELATLHGSKVISLAEWLAARKPVEARLQAAQAMIAHHEGKDAVVRLLRPGVNVAERFAALDLDRQRALVAALLEYVPIAPHDRSCGRAFQPGRIGEPKWRA